MLRDLRTRLKRRAGGGAPPSARRPRRHAPREARRGASRSSSAPSTRPSTSTRATTSSASSRGSREHLAPRGLFVVDLSMPRLEDLARDPSRPFHAPRFRHPTTGVLVKNREHFDYDPARQVLFVSMEFEPVGAPGRGVGDAARAPAVLPAGVGGAPPLQRVPRRAGRGRLPGRAADEGERRDGVACEERPRARAE